jgi:hypothetical protein
MCSSPADSSAVAAQLSRQHYRNPRIVVEAQLDNAANPRVIREDCHFQQVLRPDQNCRRLPPTEGDGSLAILRCSTTQPLHQLG